jgi:hypothetical protein
MSQDSDNVCQWLRSNTRDKSARGRWSHSGHEHENLSLARQVYPRPWVDQREDKILVVRQVSSLQSSLHNPQFLASCFVPVFLPQHKSWLTHSKNSWRDWHKDKGLVLPRMDHLPRWHCWPTSSSRSAPWLANEFLELFGHRMWSAGSSNDCLSGFSLALCFHTKQ